MRTIQREIRARTIILTIAIATNGFISGQEGPQVAPAPPPVTAENPRGNLTPAAPTAEAAPKALAAVDQTFLQKAAELHATGAELAKLTEKNAGTEEVQALGQELLAEHTRSIAALREIARGKSFELTASPTATQQATVSEFAGKVGQSFDDSYRAQAMSNHEQAIHVFAEAARATKDPDVRNFAERSLGDMKDRHAAMGGAAVQLKGEMALKLPKPATTPAAVTATTKAGKGKKGSKTKATAAAATADAGQAPNALPAGTRSTSGPASTSPAAALTTPAASEPLVSPPPQTANATTKVAATRTVAPRNEEFTETESDVRAYDPTAPAARNSSSRTREARMQTLIVGEPSGVAAPTAETTRTSNRSTRVTTTQEAAADSEVSAAPVPRIVVQPRRTARATTGEVEPAGSASRVIIRQAPSRRTFRIFGGDDDD